MKEDEQQAARLDAVFPCILKILPTCIFNKKDPIVLGVDVVEGIAKVSHGATPQEQPAQCRRIEQRASLSFSLDAAQQGCRVQSRRMQPRATLT